MGGQAGQGAGCYWIEIWKGTKKKSGEISSYCWPLLPYTSTNPNIKPFRPMLGRLPPIGSHLWKVAQPPPVLPKRWLRWNGRTALSTEHRGFTGEEKRVQVSFWCRLIRIVGEMSCWDGSVKSWDPPVRFKIKAGWNEGKGARGC